MAKNSIKIMRVLLERQDEELNIAKISRYSKIDYKNTHKIIKDLEKEKLIVVKMLGQNRKIILNKKVHPLIFETEYNRRQELFEENRNLRIIHKRLSELDFPFIVLLFGSHVKGKATKHSDIDLLIISENKRKEQIQEVLDLFPLKLHLTFTNFEEFMLMMKTREFSVVSEAVKKNIIIIGIEDYYRLLENAE